MAEVRPDEVSAILREQLSGARTEAELEEVGTVLQVGDGVARIYGLSKAQAGELLEFENGLKAMVLNLEEDNVGAVLFGDSKGVKEGDTVKRTKKIASIMAGEGMLGRVVNTLGNPIDGKGPITGNLYEMPLERNKYSFKFSGFLKFTPALLVAGRGVVHDHSIISLIMYHIRV